MYVMFCDINCIIIVKIDLYSLKLMEYLCKNVMYNICNNMYVRFCVLKIWEYSFFFFLFK